MTNEVVVVVALLRKVQGDRKWDEVSNLGAVDRKRVIKEV